MSAEESRKERLQRFVSWVGENAVGDEKSHAHIFIDRLFQAFGRPGALEVGGQPEFRIRKAAEDGGGVAFADYVWKPVVLIEMKRRGTDLSRHYRQAFDYWTRLVPGRPRYVVLCNFEEFWIYDFENQVDYPVDRLTLTELPDRYEPLAFLFVTNEAPIFGNDHVAVTREAADHLARCFTKLTVRGVERQLAQRFILQVLIAMFSEDIGLLERNLIKRLLMECKEPADSFDLLGGLFVEMNTPGRTPGGRYKRVDYFNGGIFRAPARLELYQDEVAQLRAAADADWSMVRPEIFGVLFEHSLGDMEGERRAFGVHFTNPVDIMKIVGPTIVEPWREQIEGARTVRRLSQLHERMLGFTVLDPACGSGNFLYVAYRELKRLEAQLLERMGEVSKRARSEQMRLPFVTARNFRGMDIKPFAVELAKVTLMIARKLAEDELHMGENPLPLDNLDANFIAGDALIDESGNPSTWPRADVIIGNPPYGGAKLLKPQHGADYANALRRAYPEVPGMADYCIYWFRKAHDLLPACTKENPMAGRAGLVGTQNVRNNQSRVGGLDHIVETGTILEAVDNQPWSGEADVNVSIVNWAKTQESSLLPKKRVIWSLTKPQPGPRALRLRGSGPATKEYELDKRECAFINSALSDGADRHAAKILTCNKTPKRCFQGKIPGYDEFLLDEATAKRLARDSPGVVVPYLTGRELLSEFRIARWALDFRDMNMMEAAGQKSAFEYCRRHVLVKVREKCQETEDKDSDMLEARNDHLDRWWQFWCRRDELNAALSRIPRYIACSRVTRRPVMVFLDPSICPSDLIQVFALADDYSFGVLQSSAHFRWFKTSSKLKVETDMRYSVREVFEKFPWPQSPTERRVAAVADAGREVRSVRCAALKGSGNGLRGVYRTLELPGRHPLKDAHAALDAAVLAAYGFSAKKDLLAQILELNLVVASRIENGQAVTAPGVPPNYPNPAALVTGDCIRPIP
jgi:hypothetical protein